MIDSPSQIIAFFDGLCEPVNPGGVGAWGVVIMRDTVEILAKHGIVGEGQSISNNVAEYAGLINLLDLLLVLGYRSNVVIKGDSQLVINQMKGIWGAKGGLYLNYYKHARDLLRANFMNIHFVWVPREQNGRADGLSREAYEQHCKDKGIPATYMARSQAKNVIFTRSFEETNKALEKLRVNESVPDLIVQDEMPVLKGEPSKKTASEFKSVIEIAARQKNMRFPSYIDDVEKLSPEQVKELKSAFDSQHIVVGGTTDLVIGSHDSGMSNLHNFFNQVPKPATEETCETCKWLKWRGPHVGCFPDGKYRKWLPKSSIFTSKCELFKQKDETGEEKRADIP